MSDVSPGEGWWLASDGRWYPPTSVPGPMVGAPPSSGSTASPLSSPGPDSGRTHTFPPSQAPPGSLPPYPASGYSAPGSQQPWYPSPGYPAPGYPPPGYPLEGHGDPYPHGRATNSLAIASLVLAFVFAPAAIVTGHIARSQIRRTGESGGGLALAGLIIGYCYIGFFVLFLAVLIPVFLSVNKDIGRAFSGPSTRSHVAFSVAAARSLYLSQKAFPATQTQFLAEMRGQVNTVIVSGTTPPTRGSNVVSAYVLATRQIAIFAAVDWDTACWVEAVNESSGSVDTIPAGTSFYGRNDDAGRSCRAESFASSGSATWRASFNTFPRVT